jgi:glycerophosphoryl diester phosphodiesterase
MQIYAHRAGRGLAAENTLFACQKCLQHPIDFIDFDIGMTQDGVLVVTHDLELNPDLTRDRDGNFITQPIPISKLNFSQLADYNVGLINPLSKYCSYFPEQQKVAYASIPSLRDAIHTVQERNPSVNFQIEIKTDPKRPHLTVSIDAFSEALIALLNDLEIISMTEVQAFDFRCLLSLMKRNSAIKTTFLTLNGVEETEAHLGSAGYALKDFNHSITRMIKDLGGHCWSPFQMDLTKKQFQDAKSLDLKVVPWGYPEKEGTEFNITQIKQMMNWGIDGIITDRPDKLLKLL